MSPEYLAISVGSNNQSDSVDISQTQIEAKKPMERGVSIGFPDNSVRTLSPKINVTIGFDAVLATMILSWLIWEKYIRPQLQNRLVGIWAPIEEERRLTNLLAQMCILAGADRAILTCFHNGVVDHDGYHLQRMTTINQFITDGASAMAHPIKDLPIGRIMVEIEEMLKTGTWTPIEPKPNQPSLCKAHLERNSIFYMKNRLVMIGNLPIGIVSLQYTKKRKVYFDLQKSPAKMELLNHDYNSIVEIMKRRVVKPPLMTRFKLIFSNFVEMNNSFPFTPK